MHALKNESSILRRAATASMLAFLLADIGMAAPLQAAAVEQPVSAANTAQLVRYRSAKVDGIQIFYREAGDPALPSILLLHGFSSSSHMFRDLMPLLAQNFHLIAPDYPGFGYSEAPSANEFEPTFSGLEKLMESFVKQVGLHSFVIYMQDFGGPVGLRMAVSHPEWINGLIIQNANSYVEGLAREQQSHDGNAGPDQPTSARVVTPGFIRYMYQTGARDAAGLNPDAWTVDIAALGRPEAKRIQAALIENYVSNIQQYPQWQAYLRERQPKALVVWGKNDRGFLPAGAEAYRRDLHDVTVKYFDTGHFALEEDAAAIALAIVQSFALRH
jgi:pimeloyl-ACP methyl ester carboxylesterase